MKKFWVRLRDKNRFVEAVKDYHFTEISEPDFRMTRGANGIALIVTKYYQYGVDITDEEYLFLKLQFDLEEVTCKDL